MEKGICEVTKEITPWSATEYTVGVVTFKETYDSPPHIQLTASQDGRPGDFGALLCSIITVTATNLVIDFDGFRLIDGVWTFVQEVYPGAKCYWVVV